MSQIDFIFAVIDLFWFPILLISFGICMGIKAVYDAVEYRRWRKK